MAGTGQATYQGQLLPLPGTYGFVNPQGLSFPSSPTTPIVYLIGNSVGGTPNTPLSFTSYAQAAATLQGGDLLDGTRYAMKGGAGIVVCLRPYSATQSSLTLKDATGNPSILLTSVDYGAWTTGLLASISGTSGALVATLVDNYHGTRSVSSALGNAIQLKYTGNGTAAVAYVANSLPAPTVAALSTATTGGTIAGNTTVYVRVVPRNASGAGTASTEQSIAVPAGTNTNTVSTSITAQGAATSYDIYASAAAGTELYYGNVLGAASGAIAVSITSVPTGTAPVPAAPTAGADLVTWLTGATDGSVNLDVSLAAQSVSTLQALTAYLNGQTGYAAYLQQGAGTVASTELDPTSDQSLLGTSGYMFTSDLGTVIAWFNATGAVTAAAASTTASPPTAVGLTPFAGGSNGTTQLTNWQDAANQLSTYAPLLRYVVPLTSEAAFMSAVNSVVQSNAQVMSNYLQEGFYGGAVGDTQADALANASTLNTRRAVYAWPDFYDNNVFGVKTNFPGYMLAAYYAGIRAGLGPQVPLTAKSLAVLQLAQTATTSQIAALNLGGVAAAMTDTSGNISVSLGTTTEQKAQDTTNLYYVEESVTNSVDSTVLFLVQNLNAEFKGGNNYGPVTTQLVLSYVNSLLGTVKDVFKWIADYAQVTQVQPLPTNPTFFVIPITLYVVSPINGAILQINLQIPASQVATAA